MSDFICPYCFEHANTNEVWFQCINPSCLSPDEERTAFELGISVDQLEENYIHNYQTVFKGHATNALFRMFGATNPTHATCPECGNQTTMRVCPHCHSTFPHGVDSLSNLMIAIVGAKETGKSHYIAILIKRINDLFRSFNWTLTAINDETMNLYESQFFNPLYGEKPRTLNVTQTAKSNQNVKTPLLYTLGLTKKNKYMAVILAFFDTAGEDMDDQAQMQIINRYIYNASGIILLFDPLQMREVRRQLVEEYQFPPSALPEDTNTYAGEIINRVINVIHSGKGLSQQKKIPIPLAVAFSKIDVLKQILGANSRIFQESMHRGSFNIREFSEINGTIRDWVEQMDQFNQSSFVQQTGVFENSAFFGVSALGANPDDNGRLQFTPRPIRVEDPFLWLLWKNKFIEGVQS
ncbi:MAG: hypothetical protein Q4G59_11450 [Planctomycetia bacterium]|nr:hypothetical protein [Planctomycetia bacterium]